MEQKAFFIITMNNILAEVDLARAIAAFEMKEKIARLKEGLKSKSDLSSPTRLPEIHVPVKKKKRNLRF